MCQLELREPNRWRGFWRDQKVRLVVAGTPDAPNPELEATLRAVMEGWQEVQRAIAELVTSLAADDHVPLEPASRGGFAAGSCGFDGALAFESISVVEPGEPGRVEITFYTGYPDGYATYRVVLVDGQPIRITAFAS